MRDVEYKLATETRKSASTLLINRVRVQSPDVKGQSTVGENGESSKGKTLFLLESRASKIIFEKQGITKHLYIKAHIDGKPVFRVLVDNGAAVNITSCH